MQLFSKRPSQGQRGYLDALVVDYTVAAETKIREKNLTMGWVDYQKLMIWFLTGGYVRC